ncbi:hypothetical protein ACWEN3_12230 [Streptomyces sp. NPDC004561]
MSTVPPAEGPDEHPDEPSAISDEQWAAFLRDAAEGGGGPAPKEPSARARMLARRLRGRPRAASRPRGPRGGALRARATATVPWLAAAAVVLLGAYQMDLLSWFGPPASGPAEAVALPGGGVSDGDHCGARGYHYFPLPADASSPPPPDSPDHPRPGPQLVLGSYGYERLSRAPGHLNVGLLFAPGPKGSLKLSRTLGGEGVAVEIEGPHGLVAGAYGLPVTWSTGGKADGADSTRIDLTGGGGGEVVLPLKALCPGYDAHTVTQGLMTPVDSHNTITGQPPYTLTVSVRDPAIGESRTARGLPAGGNLLNTNNLVPTGP